MPYPPRPQLRPLPTFAGTARTGTVPSAQLQAQLEDFVLAEYAAGRSLRQIAELVDRVADRGPPRVGQAPNATPGGRRPSTDRPDMIAPPFGNKVIRTSAKRESVLPLRGSAPAGRVGPSSATSLLAWT
jgi:hypothetical protein